MDSRKTARFRFVSALSRLIVVVGVALLLGTGARPAEAFKISDQEVVVPVVAHLHGNNGTQWRSDVWIQNTSSNELLVTLNYYPQSGGVLTETVSLEAYHGTYLHDIVLDTFGLESSKGMLILSADHPAFEARARVYNTGDPAGEFGQAVPGLPLGRLSREGYLSGVTTAQGTRLSIGIANPTDESFSVTVVVRDSVTREELARRTLDLGPHELVQLDRVADLWNLPARDIVYIGINSGETTHPFYAYASVVRNDTGDATFLFGTAPSVGPQ